MKFRRKTLVVLTVEDIVGDQSISLQFTPHVTATLMDIPMHANSILPQALGPLST